jgi:glycosyltransferase involved in cell wall biosynthesis
MPLRILHILGDSSQEGTAIARIVQSLYRHMPREDFQIYACFVGRSGPLSEEFQRIGIPTHVVAWKHPSRDVAGAVRLASFLRSSRFDVLHFHWGGAKVRGLGKLVSGARVVLHLHSSTEAGRLERPQQISTRNSDAVIAVSKASAVNSKHPMTRVIYPGVEIPEAAQRAEDPNLCGCAVRLTPIKGIPYLLGAMSLLRNDLPDLRLEIAGDGPLRAELELEAARLGLADHVKFLGWVDPWDQLRLRWAVMVQPSLKEGLPLSVLEAMADGLPIVASSVGGVPEVVFSGQTGMLVPAGDPRALAEAVRTLLKNADLRQKLGAAAARTIRECFSAQRMADQIAVLYRELL